MSKPSWTERLFGGFKKTSERLSENLAEAVTKAKLDDATLDDVEDALIMSDLGPTAAARIRESLKEKRFGLEISADELKQAVADEIAAILRPVAKPLEITAFPRPQVLLVIGVNGSGKTTTIAKLAHLFVEDDYNVMLAAGDTFRAAAIGQLQTWAERVGVPIVRGPEGGDPASIVFDAVKKGTEIGTDVLIVDTAGRLQNKRELMDELAKIRKVLGRLEPRSTARRGAGPRRDQRPERAQPDRRFQGSRGRHRPRHDQAGRHGARRGSGAGGGRDTACPSMRSAWARKSTICDHSTRTW